MNREGVNVSMWKRVGCIVIVLLAVVGLPRLDNDSCSEPSAATEAKSFYLSSIYEDTRLLVEAIELFIQRDYPRLWTNLEAGQSVDRRTTDDYLREVRHFEKILDNLFREYATFRKEGATPNEKLYPLESEILQMLAYCYLRTGDLYLVVALQDKFTGLGEDFSVKIRNIEGELVDLRVTEELNKWGSIIRDKARLIKLQTIKFLPSDSENRNVFCRVSPDSGNNPLHPLYLGYYARFFPGLGDTSVGTIHFGDIVRYSSRVSQLGLVKDEGTFFPVVGGDIEFISQDPSIIVLASDQKDVYKLEHLFLFKGYAGTSVQAMQAVGKDAASAPFADSAPEAVVEAATSVVDRQFVLRPMSGPSTVSRDYKAGDQLRYGLYDLFDSNAHLGQVEFVPCVRGENCPKTSEFKRVTKVNVYEHEFAFSQDVLDLIADNEKFYRGVGPTEVKALEAERDWRIVRRGSESGGKTQSANKQQVKQQSAGSQVHLFRGCASAPL